VADLTINVTVSYRGDKNYCKKILEEKVFLKVTCKSTTNLTFQTNALSIYFKKQEGIH